MLPFLLSAMFAGSVGWLLYRTLRQFRLYETFEPAGASAVTHDPPIAVIVPLRNEAHNVLACLQSLIEQDYPREQLEIVAVDDNSNDQTAAIVRAIAARDHRVRLLQIGALPAGWTGKPHACWIGALDTEAEWLCFVDADTVSEPALLRSAVFALRERNLDLLSFSPLQELTHFLDRLVMPLGFLAVAASMDCAEVNDSGSSEVRVNGQFIMMRTHDYFAVGGHASVRGHICEDAALARLMKASGLRVGLLGGESLIRTRMYRTAHDLWEGFSKNIAETFGGSARTSIVAISVLVIGWATPLLPIWTLDAAVRGPHPLAIAAAAGAWLAAATVVSVQLALLHHFRVPLWYGFLFPASCSVGALVALNGVLRGVRGRVYWKGRAYSSKRGTAETDIGQPSRTGSNDL